MDKLTKRISQLLLSLLIGAPGISAAQSHLPNIEFVEIPAGQFQMGTTDIEAIQFEIPPEDSLLITDEQPAHSVKLNGFVLGKYEITQQQWFSVMRSKPGPDEYWQDPNWQRLPVVSISWHDTQRFIKRLNQLDEKHQYRLPTEAEWEYVAKSGTTSIRPFELEQLGEYAWLLANSGDRPHPVGQRKVNALGVYDIFGNAWEWVSDWYQPNAYQRHAPANPTGPEQGKLKVRRGGSYHCAPHIVRSAYRAADKPGQRYSVLGFRLVREKIKQ